MGWPRSRTRERSTSRWTSRVKPAVAGGTGSTRQGRFRHSIGSSPGPDRPAPHLSPPDRRGHLAPERDGSRRAGPKHDEEGAEVGLCFTSPSTPGTLGWRRRLRDWERLTPLASHAKATSRAAARWLRRRDMSRASLALTRFRSRPRQAKPSDDKLPASPPVDASDR